MPILWLPLSTFRQLPTSAQTSGAYGIDINASDPCDPSNLRQPERKLWEGQPIGDDGEEKAL